MSPEQPAVGAPPGSLERLVAHAARPTLLLLGAGQRYDGAVHPGLTVHADGAAPVAAPDTPWGAVVWSVADREAVRASAPLVGAPGRARAVVCRVATAIDPLVPEVRPEWADVLDLDAHLVTDAGTAIVGVTRIRFAGPVPVAEVVAALARDAGSSVAGHCGLVVVPAEVDADEKVPPDVVLGPATTGAREQSEVTGRAPYVVEEGPLLVDEGVFNATGFRRDAQGPVLEVDAGSVTAATVREVRDAQLVRAVSSPDPRATAHGIAALAMAGVPVVADPDDAVATLVGPTLATLVSTTPDDDGELQDRRLRREEWSVRLRRAALTRHSAPAWRHAVASLAGLRPPATERVSVLLVTRRADLLAFALSQVARQRLPAPLAGEVELVLATHGFTADRGVLRDGWGDRPLSLLTADEDELFGDVLERAARAAGGDVLVKMDDDDWYGPDVLGDLLWARHWSGADLVGMPAEMVYLEQVGVTVRRRGPAEGPAGVVAGGTMTIGRERLREAGGWRSVPRHVDAHLLAAVRRAGGTVYRTQGLGYVLRRAAGGGHTWVADDGYFLTRRIVAGQWRGFHPSALLEPGLVEWTP